MPLSSASIERLRKQLESPTVEGRIKFMYLDTEGNVTVGVGCLLDTSLDASALAFYVPADGKLPERLATPAEKEAEFKAISALDRGHLASWYKDRPGLLQLVLKDDEINSLFKERVEKFDKELRNIYGKDVMDKLSDRVKESLWDMIFNLGATKLSTQFPSFNKAIKDGDWTTAATESNRTGIPDSRNSYVKGLLNDEAAATAAASAASPPSPIKSTKMVTP